MEKKNGAQNTRIVNEINLNFYGSLICWNTSVNMCSTISFHFESKIMNASFHLVFAFNKFRIFPVSVIILASFGIRFRFLKSNFKNFLYAWLFFMLFLSDVLVAFLPSFRKKCRPSERNDIQPNSWASLRFSAIDWYRPWLKFYLNELIRIYNVTTFKWIVNDPCRFGPSTTLKENVLESRKEQHK